MGNITPKEAIANLNHLYGMVSPDIQRSLDVAIKALERPKDDLISREALKKYAREVMSEQNATNFSLLKMFDEIIDNAQTVEPKRPQGEWKTVKGIDGDEYYECSNCGEPWVLMAGTPKDNNMNFCPNCGAAMKGSAE